MKSNILNYINILEGYKTAIKNLHWSSKNMSEHKLCDDIADTIASTQDKISEIAQGIFGKIKKNELKPRQYKINTTKDMLDSLLSDTKSFYKELSSLKLVGLRSEIETFIGSINQYQYLILFCLKEDKLRKTNTILESKLSKILHNEIKRIL